MRRSAGHKQIDNALRPGRKVRRFRCHGIDGDVGIQLGALVGSSVIIEQVFGLPGVGWFLLQGVYNRDYPVVQATALLLVLVVGVISLGVDLAYAYLDPRITYA